MNKVFILIVMASASNVLARQQPSTEKVMGKRVSKTLRFASPLQTLTLFPKDVPTTTPREKFLPKFKAALSAEKKAREALAKQREFFDGNNINPGESDWDKRAEDREKVREEREEQFVSKAVDRALSRFKETPDITSKNQNKYQFVGVVQPPGSAKKVKWYARKRAGGSKWNVRLLHVNRDVIVRDMFVSGEIDLFAKYINTGKPRDELQEGEDPKAPRRPMIEADYSIKKRTPLNLWNFNPKHFFTDSSGAFWRERRLSPGLYTDGKLVYESKYRYSDGKNGMKPISRLDTLLKSKSVKDTVKNDLLKRLKEDSPDVVIEE